MTLLKHTTFMFAIFWPSVSIFSCTQLYFSTLKTKKPLPVHLNLKYLVEREKHLKTTLFLWFWFISEQGHFSKTLKESISLDMWLTLVWKQFWLKKITQLRAVVNGSSLKPYLYNYTSIWQLYITRQLISLESHVTGRAKHRVSGEWISCLTVFFIVREQTINSSWFQWIPLLIFIFFINKRKYQFSFFNCMHTDY